MIKEQVAKPRILHLHSTFSAGGKEVRCAQLITAFGPEFHHTIVSAMPDNMNAKDLIPSDISIAYPTDFPSLVGWPTPIRLYRLAAAMRGYDLVLTYNWGAVDAVMAHAILGMVMNLPPLIHHEDGFNEDEQLGLKPARNFYRRLALTRSTALVVPSQVLEEIALRVWKQPNGRVKHIPNGIDIHKFAHSPAQDALPGIVKKPGEFWVGTLAGLRKVKNLPRLVEAFATLPQQWKLVIVGEGPEEEALRKQAEELGVSHRLHLPGFVADPWRFVGLFDIFALSSDTEQFPISVLEAMAAGLPVVSTNVGDVAAMISKANQGFISDKRDGHGFSQALNAVVGDENLRKELGKANHLKALEHYDADIMIAAYRHLYMSALTDRAGL